jgi:hypothetical protein
MPTPMNLTFFRKPTGIIIAAAGVLAIVIGIVLLTNVLPIIDTKKPLYTKLDVETILRRSGIALTPIVTKEEPPSAFHDAVVAPYSIDGIADACLFVYVCTSIEAREAVAAKLRDFDAIALYAYQRRYFELKNILIVASAGKTPNPDLLFDRIANALSPLGLPSRGS